MKFFILCAGLGKRISKYSNNKPKCLIKYLDKPLLEHWINKFNTKKNVLLINKHYQYSYTDNFLNKIQTKCEINTVYEENSKPIKQLKILIILKKRKILLSFIQIVFLNLILENFTRFILNVNQNVLYCYIKQIM